MCLITLAYNCHPNYQLIVAANRDERYARSTAPLHWWEDAPGILAGRDLEQMGTWMGITKSGRFAALTNFRDPSQPQDNKRTRGGLVRGFLEGEKDPEYYLEDVSKHRDEYQGFNLLVGDTRSLWYYANVDDRIIRLSPGVYGLSNHLLDTDWPKVLKGKSGLSRCIDNREQVDPGCLFEMLSDAEPAGEEELPDTGVKREWEKQLSPIFIKTAHYGTRSSAVLMVGRDREVIFIERTFSHQDVKENRCTFKIDPP
jgi:uncharacterized protein with NRDE domain